MFCRTRHGADRVVKQLSSAGVRQRGRCTAAARRRSATRRWPRSSRPGDALVATDVAARGIHVDAVACVVHFDPAADAKEYLHRSGRTGRAGASGTVVSFVTDDTADAVRSLQRALGVASDRPRNKRTDTTRRNRGARAANYGSCANAAKFENAHDQRANLISRSALCHAADQVSDWFHHDSDCL